MQYKIYDYDVWGNEYDGYDVNNKWETKFKIKLPKDYTKNQLIASLIKVGFFNDSAAHKTNEISINDTGEVIYIDHKDMPFCELQVIN